MLAVSAGERRRAIGARSAAPSAFDQRRRAGRRLGVRWRRAAAAAAGGPSGGDACMKGFVPLREEAEKRGKLIKAASERHAPPDEACKLIGNFGAGRNQDDQIYRGQCGQMRNSAADRRPAQDRPQEHREDAEAGLQRRAAGGEPARPAGPSLSDVLGSSAALPEAQPAKKGGSTFDTLNGNVLTR